MPSRMPGRPPRAFDMSMPARLSAGMRTAIIQTSMTSDQAMSATTGARIWLCIFSSPRKRGGCPNQFGNATDLALRGPAREQVGPEAAGRVLRQVKRAEAVAAFLEDMRLDRNVRGAALLDRQ